MVVQLNPKLASDYFSIIKMFFMREGEDSQNYSRITSSINILFYVYCSLMIGYYLMIIFRFIPSHYVVALGFQADTFGGAMFLWIKLSAIILTIVFLKVVLVYCLAIMFGLTEIAGIHIFNWVRLLLVVFGSLTILLFFIFHFARSEREFPHHFAEDYFMASGWMDVSHHFKIEQTNDALHVSFIFVHLCHRIDSLIDYYKGSLQLARFVTRRYE